MLVGESANNSVLKEDRAQKCVRCESGDRKQRDGGLSCTVSRNKESTNAERRSKKQTQVDNCGGLKGEADQRNRSYKTSLL